LAVVVVAAPLVARAGSEAQPHRLADLGAMGTRRAALIGGRGVAIGAGRGAVAAVERDFTATGGAPDVHLARSPGAPGGGGHAAIVLTGGAGPAVRVGLAV